MTPDDVIRIAREAGFTRHNPHSELMVIHSNGSWIDIEEQLTRFAELVAAAEREACAKVCEGVKNGSLAYCIAVRAKGYTAEFVEGQADGADDCMLGIRARGDAK